MPNSRPGESYHGARFASFRQSDILETLDVFPAGCTVRQLLEEMNIDYCDTNRAHMLVRINSLHRSKLIHKTFHKDKNTNPLMIISKAAI